MEELKKLIDLNQQERLNKFVKEEKYKYWLGGFIEGEGALVVSIVRNDKVKNRIRLQPEFNVVQHENGINILYSFKIIFGNLGSINKKSSSEKVWVYSIKGVQNIKSYVLPFFEKYVIEYSSKYRCNIFEEYCKIINTLDSNRNKAFDNNQLIELIKLVYTLNPEGKGKKRRKRTLNEVISIINQNNV